MPARPTPASMTRALSPNPGGFNDPSLGYVYKVPGDNMGYAYFVLRAWTGDFTSYAAAVAGGALVGTTPVFVNNAQLGLMPTPDLAQMPALILKPVPEPSTLLLAGAGLLGLLAYAWRKRK